ncbi:MAG: ArnT family glycosyltransferase, partial [Candidatus Binatia bacterium]
MSGRREVALVIVTCVIAYLTGIGDIAFYTRGEPREGLVVREMLRTGAWLVPARPEGEVARKPPLYYWLAAPALYALPDAPELALRVPSAALASGAVVGTWAVARAVVGPPAGLVAALILATAFEWTRAATSARVDMALAAPLTAVLAAWMLVMTNRDRRWLVLAAAGATLATLAKGPVALALPALAAGVLAVWQRDPRVLRRLGVVPVLGVAAVLGGLWYVVAFAEQGRAFLDVVVKENLVRFIDTDDARTGHAHGVFFLVIVGLVGLLPWVPLLPLAGRAPGGDRSEPLRLAAAWAFGVVVFFSLANAKRSVYLLPAFPAVALLVAAGASTGGTRWARWLAVTYLPALLVLGVAGLALALGIDPGAALRSWLRPDDAHGATAVGGAAHHSGPVVAALALVTIGGALAIEQARRQAAWRRVVFVVAALTVAWTAVFDAAVHPAVSRTRSLREFMMRVDRLVPADDAIEVAFPTDPGLRFYAPRRLVRFAPAAADHAHHLLLWEEEWQ